MAIFKVQKVQTAANKGSSAVTEAAKGSINGPRVNKNKKAGVVMAEGQ